MNFNNKYLIPAVIGITGILVAGVYLYVNYVNFSSGTLSAQQAADKAIAYINNNIEEGAVASLTGVSAEKSVYRISLTINETPYESYITKDGKFLFPSGIDLENQSEATTSVP